MDVEATRAIYREQTRMGREGVRVGAARVPYVDEADDTLVHDEIRHTRADLALEVDGGLGVRVDAGRLRAIERATREELGRAAEACVADGLMRREGGGSPRTPRQSRPSLLRPSRPAQPTRVLIPASSSGATRPRRRRQHQQGHLESVDDPRLAAPPVPQARKTVTTYLEPFAAGTRSSLCVGYDVLKRNGPDVQLSPNIQNLPLQRRPAGVPGTPAGHVFVISDRIASSCGPGPRPARSCSDLHVGGQLPQQPGFRSPRRRGLSDPGVSQAEGARLKAAKKTRVQRRPAALKPVNFGLPGGMGAESFVKFAKGYGRPITLDQSKWLKERWRATWPEAALYLRWVGDTIRDQGGEKATIRQLRSGAFGPGACTPRRPTRCSKASPPTVANWSCGASRLNATSTPSPPIRLAARRVRARRVPAGVPEGRASEAADRLALIMVEEMERVISVPVRTTPCVSRRWAKKPRASAAPTGAGRSGARGRDAPDVEALAAFDDVEEDA